MKISELNTKSFLGGTGAAENSYVLINYEDNSTSEPVTYKASLQELGKAIANDLKLPSVTVNGNTITNFKVKGVSNGAYTETAVGVPQNDGPSMGDVNAVVITALASAGLASTGYVTAAVDDLASTGYVDEAVANASFSGFNPAKSIACSIASSVNGQQIIETQALLPIMILNDSSPTLYAQSSTNGNYMDRLGELVTATDFNGLDDIAYIGTSDAKSCIRNRHNIFQGFLSTT